MTYAIHPHQHPNPTPPDPGPVVVLVEDDAPIRMVMTAAFEDAGFVVLEAGAAAEAIQLMQHQPQRVDVLFTDVNMPGEMDGLKLARHTRQKWPWIEIVITSGLANPLARDIPKDSHFIPKPYSVGKVINRIRDLPRGGIH